MTRFSRKTLEFLARAGRQKKADWLERNRAEYEETLIEPTRQLALSVARLLKPQAAQYRFPTRNFARLRRSGDRARKYGALFRDYVGISASRDSGSRFTDLPSLYFHFSPEDIFSAGGLYMADSRQVKRIRMWIDQDPSELEALMKDRAFARIYPEGLGDERKLKTKPRDYPIDHPRIEWLKLTGYYVWRPIPKKIFFSDSLPEVLAEHWAQVLRLNRVLDRYLSRVPPESRVDAPRGLAVDRFGDFQAPEVDWSAES